ncbi:hypothetical protein FS847_04435 [Streptomyces sp. ISID311]|nr:hypothetical protein FS847_04435 [Streptomyces sp. ISID311]
MTAGTREEWPTAALGWLNASGHVTDATGQEGALFQPDFGVPR